MEIIFRCHECRHEERGNDSRALMLKIRMWNHITRAHPALIERFKEVVEVEQGSAGVRASV